jgi:hypothetical protein
MAFIFRQQEFFCTDNAARTDKIDVPAIGIFININLCNIRVDKNIYITSNQSFGYGLDPDSNGLADPDQTKTVPQKGKK